MFVRTCTLHASRSRGVALRALEAACSLMYSNGILRGTPHRKRVYERTTRHKYVLHSYAARARGALRELTYRVYWILRSPALRSWSAWPGFARAPNAVPLRSKCTGSARHAPPGHSSVRTTVTGLPEHDA